MLQEKTGAKNATFLCNHATIEMDSCIENKRENAF